MSAAQNLTVLMRRHDSPTMTWADIIAEREARGLSTDIKGPQALIITAPRPAVVALAPAPAPVKAPKAKRAPKATKAPEGPRMVWVGEGSTRRMVDSRTPENTTPCTAPLSTVVPTTAAQAAKARRVAMSACSCRLCQLALHPAENFAALAAFGLDTIGAESASVWRPKWQEKKGA